MTEREEGGRKITIGVGCASPIVNRAADGFKDSHAVTSHPQLAPLAQHSGSSMRHATDEGTKAETSAIEQVEHGDPGSEVGHLDRTLQSLSAGIARIERKLDRILALAVEARGRPRL